MKLCYIVHREENVMVYESQVLEYLQLIRQQQHYESVELIVFRHEKNLMNREEVEKRIGKYVENWKTFATLPVLSMMQMRMDAHRLRKYVTAKYRNEQVAVICRGDLAAYVGTKAFKDLPNSRVLYDNRGLAYEESIMSYGNHPLHIINRNVKRKCMQYAKDYCDVFNFVTTAMRDYFISEYHYPTDRPYTVIPTLLKREAVDADGIDAVRRIENISASDYVISYIGAVQAWQSSNQLVELIRKIGEKNSNVRFLFLMKGSLPGIETLADSIKDRITVKQIPHSQMKYYLPIMNMGIVLRDNNIVNRVAAPTKIAEYLASGVNILYSGDIGIIEDISKLGVKQRIIPVGEGEPWMDELQKDICAPQKNLDGNIARYFDMQSRQSETLSMFCHSFMIEKVK